MVGEGTHRRREARQGRSRRLGALYEDAVCELFRKFCPRARVTAGVWVDGPDGRRELDVDIRERVGPKDFRGMIECKDFNPQTTGPVGIGYIDAVDSKRRDLGLDFVLLCSNAGYTAEAIRKARRVDIGLLSVSRKYDRRVRFAITDEIYIRHLRLKQAPRCHVSLVPGEPPVPHEVYSSGEPMFQGRPISPWFYKRFLGIISRNPIVNGTLLDAVRFSTPIKLEWPAGAAHIEKVTLETEVEGAWFAQTVELSSPAGFYDWLRRRMRTAPVSGVRKLEIKGLNYFGGKWITRPPDADWNNQRLLPHEQEMKFIVLKNHFQLENSADLTPYALPEDLSLNVSELDDSFIQSVPGFSSAPVPAADVGKHL